MIYWGGNHQTIIPRMGACGSGTDPKGGSGGGAGSGGGSANVPIDAGKFDFLDDFKDWLKDNAGKLALGALAVGLVAGALVYAKKRRKGGDTPSIPGFEDSGFDIEGASSIDRSAGRGAFDENGVAPCAILVFEHRLYLYYAGYQLGQKVRFCAYSGLAVSDDHGVTFKRLSNVPVTDRTDDAMYFRVIHSIMNDDGIFKVWYGAGSTYDVGADKTLPRYNVQMMESKSLFEFPKHGHVVVETKGDEYRVGRPYVFKNDDEFIMFYGTGSEAVPYRLGYATSSDSYRWERKDDLSIEGPSATWDSEMMAYPAVVTNNDVSYLFYNGNDYGREGFGYAVIEGL
mgnify:CR=1 FL=1